jgi:hypothetical protein
MRKRSAVAIAAAAVTVVGAGSAIASVVLRLGAASSGAPIASAPRSQPGNAAPRSTATSTLPAPSAPDSVSGSLTRWHYTANGNFSSSGKYLPGALGFNLADVSSVAELDSLPAGVSGLVWVGYCGGANSTFRAMVSPLIGRPKIFGFYMMDEPDPSTCLSTNLKAECDWIHRYMPEAKTFALIENRGPATAPTFANSYTPASSGLNLIGVDPYPVRSDLRSPDYGEISGYVQAAEEAGWPQSSLVPVFQAFGGGTWRGGGAWMLPTPAQEQQILAIWASVLPTPLFDYAYSWGQQNGDQSLSSSPALQQIFAAHNE